MFQYAAVIELFGEGIARDGVVCANAPEMSAAPIKKADVKGTTRFTKSANALNPPM
jgi:hypothetical protein